MHIDSKVFFIPEGNKNPIVKIAQKLDYYKQYETIIRDTEGKMRDYKAACIVSANTGEILHEFSKMDIFMGRQWMTAYCVGQFYTIENVEISHGELVYYVK